MSNASNLANIALPDFGIAGQILTSTGDTTTPVFSAIPSSDVNTTFLAGSGTVIEVGASNSSVKVNLLECPDWKLGRTGKPLLQETSVNRVSQQFALSGQFLRHTQYVIAQNPPLTGAEIMSTPNGSYPGSASFVGGVLMLDGRVFCVNNFGNALPRIYDPIKDTLITPGGAYQSHSTGALLTDGRVFCCPNFGSLATIYNPATNTVTTPNGTWPTAGFPNTTYQGSALLWDGRVFCTPCYAGTARIYDPVTDTTTTPSGTYPGGGAHFGCVLLKDGRVYMVPSQGIARIYNPFNDTLTTPSGTYPSGTSYQGCVLMADGRVYNVPWSATCSTIYNPATNTVTTPNGSFPGGTAHSGGCLLADGRVFCIPFSGSSVARIYDPATNTLTVANGTYPSSYAGCVLLPNGGVFGVPYNATTSRIHKPYNNSNFSLAALTGPYLNKY